MLRFLLVISITTPIMSSTVKTSKLRSLWNFEQVTECVLHHNALVYNNYGCWCGVGGSGTPVDGIDECCMHHDKCYDAAVDTKTCYDVPWEYVDNYRWKCLNSTAICEANQESCAVAMCACDTAVVHCWAQYDKPTVKPKCNHVLGGPGHSKFFEP